MSVSGDQPLKNPLGFSKLRSLTNETCSHLNNEISASSVSEFKLFI